MHNKRYCDGRGFVNLYQVAFVCLGRKLMSLYANFSQKCFLNAKQNGKQLLLMTMLHMKYFQMYPLTNVYHQLNLLSNSFRYPIIDKHPREICSIH